MRNFTFSVRNGKMTVYVKSAPGLLLWKKCRGKRGVPLCPERIGRLSGVVWMGVQLGLNHSVEQRLILTQDVRLSLEILQMTLPELREYLQEAALSNPLLELEDPPSIQIAGEELLKSADEGEDLPKKCSERDELFGWNLIEPAEISIDKLAQPLPEQSFTQMLQEQLLSVPGLDNETRLICEYLIECLDERGYLAFSLKEIADEAHIPLFLAQQALYLLQSLQPTGVGARTLEECLVLQLAQSKSFNAHTVALATHGLSMLAKKDYNGIARLLKCSRQEALRTADVICGLKPIPSQGYDTCEITMYQIPEAEVLIEGGELVLRMNTEVFVPVPHINESLIQLLKNDSRADTQAYLKKQIAEAQQVTRFVNDRTSTIQMLLQLILDLQREYFLHGGELRPLTMGQLAEQAGVNISTVSRALQGKTLRFNGRTLLLKDLFMRAVTEMDGRSITSGNIKQHLEKFIQQEDCSRPLSDEDLRIALEAVQISISRRTVAKYREELGIPSSSRRRR